MAAQLCPHRANPAACPLCFQVNQRKKQPPPPRTSLDPQITKGKVVSAENNPVMSSLLARKQAALDAAAAQMGAQPGIAAAAAATPAPVVPPVAVPHGAMGGVTQQAVNPHAMPRVQIQHESNDNEPYEISSQEMAQLEQAYPRRREIIEQQPVHPEAVHRNKDTGGGGRRPVVKGKPVGS